MKLALQILQAVPAILTLVGCAFGLSNKATDKEIAVYFFLAAACAWIGVIIWRLRLKHLENQADLSVAPIGALSTLRPPEQRKTDDNWIGDFRVVELTDHSIEIEVSYFYNGAAGSDNIYIFGDLVDGDGRRLSSGQTGGEIHITGKNAMLRVIIDAPSEQNYPHGVQIAKVAFKMMHFGVGGFYFKEFPYAKMWQPRDSKPQIAKPPNPPPIKTVTEPEPDVVQPPFESGLGTLWTEYTEDVFDNIIWRWKYNAHIDRTPRNIRAHCIECQQLMRKTPVFSGTSVRPGSFVQVTCNQHAFYHIKTDSHGDFIDIKERIKKKLDDGTWIEPVNQRRLVRGEAPLGGPVKAEVELPEVSVLILRVLAVNGGSCAKNEFYNTLRHLCDLDKTPPPDGLSIKFHLEELDGKFISIELGVYADGIALTHAGKQYVLDHRLNDKRPDRAVSAENAELTVARIAKRSEHGRIESALSEKPLRVLQVRPHGSVEIVYGVVVKPGH